MSKTGLGNARSCKTYFGAQFHRLACRRDNARALVAVAHSLIIAIYYMLGYGHPCTHLSTDYLDHLVTAYGKRYIGSRLCMPQAPTTISTTQSDEQQPEAAARDRSRDP